MKNHIKSLILSALLALSLWAHAAVSHSGTIITFSGVETGDNIRAYIAANPSLGTVVGRTANLNASIRPADAASEFSDNNCTWVFNSSHHWDFALTCKRFEIVDGVIIYAGGQKSHTSQIRAEVVKLENVQYRAEVGSGRTDFFGSAPVDYDFSNVQFISYGGSNFLHFNTNGGLLSNTAIKVGSGGLTFQPSASAGATLIMRDTVLDGVSGIIPNGGSNLTGVTRLENLTWTTHDTWSVSGSNRGQTYIVVNPNKHATWNGYSGQKNSNNDTYEVHTHNAKVVDETNSPLADFKLQMRRSDGTTPVYDLSTDSNGDIAEQEVVTYDQSAGSNVWTQYSDFLLRGYRYGYTLVNVVRPLQDGRIDEVITSISDILITEPDYSTALAYNTQDTVAKAYDHIAAILARDYNFEQALTVTITNGALDALGRDVIINPVGTTGEAIITPTSIELYGGFAGNIITTGTVTGVDNVTGGIIDSVADSFMTFTAVSSWGVYNTEADVLAGTNALDTGVSGETFRFNFAAATTYYLALYTPAGARITQAITPDAAGETIVSLDTTSLLTELSGGQELIRTSIADIPSLVWSATVREVTALDASIYTLIGSAVAAALGGMFLVINNNVKKASLSIPASEDLPNP